MYVLEPVLQACLSGASWTELPQNTIKKVKINLSGFIRTKL